MILSRVHYVDFPEVIYYDTIELATFWTAPLVIKNGGFFRFAMPVQGGTMIDALRLPGWDMHR